MRKHLFLTGKKQIGKSTAIRRFLEEAGLRWGGFVTVRTNAVFPGTWSVHMLRAGEEQVPSFANALFLCGQKELSDQALRFDALGCGALRRVGAVDPVDLVLLDELGPHEENARLFQEEIFTLLNGNLPVLGVLQQAESLFLDRIRNHRRVYLMEVNRENRDLIPGRIRDWYSLEWKSPGPDPAGTDSFGAIVFDGNGGDLQVLMVRSKAGWSFPKGHGQPGEEPVHAAVREIREETGIISEILPGFAGTVPSVMPGERRSVTFFLGKSREGRKAPVPLEVPDAAWVPAGDAAGLIVYDADRKVFEQALAHYRGLFEI